MVLPLVAMPMKVMLLLVLTIEQDTEPAAPSTIPMATAALAVVVRALISLLSDA